MRVTPVATVSVIAVAAVLLLRCDRTSAAPDPLSAYLQGRVSTIDKKKPVRISVTPGNRTGLAADLRITGMPALLKDVRAERLEVHATDLLFDTDKLTEENELVVKSVKRFYVNAEVSAKALTDRINSGKQTKELSAAVSFAGGKAYIKGRFRYSFVKGGFEARLVPVLQNKNQIMFVIEKLKVGGIPAPGSVRRILQKKIDPLDLGELVGAPSVDKVWIEGDRMKLLGGRRF